jgi:DNA-binding transcriptional LysR family regulator
MALELNPAHVRTLQEVVRLGGVSRAAEALHLSQPALSHHLRHLERALGTPLLERVGARLRPTPAGELLLAHAARALRELEAAREGIERLRGAVVGRLRLGTGATASIYLLPPLLRRLHARYPGIELSMVTGNSAEIAAAVVRSEIDAALITLPVVGRVLAVSHAFPDRLVAIAPATPPWRGRRRRVTPGELAREPLILYERGGTSRQVIDDWFRRAGVHPRVTMEVGNAEAIKRLVSAGLGLSVGSAMSVRAEVRARELVAVDLAPSLVRRLALVRRRDRPGGPAMTALLAEMDRFLPHAARAAAGH